MQAVPISIVIPTYNGERHIRATIQSVLGQTMMPGELVVSDSGSSDATLRIIAEETASAGFPVRVLPTPTAGMVRNWNAAASAARGEYIKFLFQDDVLEPPCLEKMWGVVARNPRVGFVWCTRRIVADLQVEQHPTGRWLLEHVDLDRGLLAIKAVQKGRRVLRSRRLLDAGWNKIGEPSAVMMKRSLFQSLGGFNERMTQLVDVEMWIRALAVSWAAFIDEPLAGFRIHPDQMTVKNSETHGAEGDWIELVRALAAPEVYRCLHCAVRRRVRDEMSYARQAAPNPLLIDVVYETARKARWLRRCVSAARGG